MVLRRANASNYCLRASARFLSGAARDHYRPEALLQANRVAPTSNARAPAVSHTSAGSLPMAMSPTMPPPALTPPSGGGSVVLLPGGSVVGESVLGGVVVVGDVVVGDVVVEDVVVEEEVGVEDVVVEEEVGVEDVVVVEEEVGGGMGCEQRITCDTSRRLLGVYDCPGIGFGNSWLSVPDFNTRSVQVDPAGGSGTVNDAVSIGSILIPVSHQNSTWFESMARAEPVTIVASKNPAIRAVTTTTDLVTLRRKCMALRPSPHLPLRSVNLDRRCAVPTTTNSANSSSR